MDPMVIEITRPAELTPAAPADLSKAPPPPAKAKPPPPPAVAPLGDHWGCSNGRNP